MTETPWWSSVDLDSVPKCWSCGVPIPSNRHRFCTTNPDCLKMYMRHWAIARKKRAADHSSKISK